MNPLWLSHFTATSSIGRGLDQTLAALRQRRGGLAPCAFETVDLATFIGEVAGVDAVQLPAHLADFDCRNNRLALLGLTQDGFAEAVHAAIAKYGAQRIGVFLGTSTSGILQTELAYRRRDPVTGALPADFNYRTTHNTFSVADFARHYFGLTGPAVVVSSACSSSAKVFGSARRMLAAGLIDAAVVGGVDSLCLTTLYGFNSLGLLSEQRLPPIRCATQRHLDRRSGGLRAAGTRPGTPGCRRRAAARHRRIQRCLSHVIAASGWPGCAHGDAGCAENGGIEAI